MLELTDLKKTFYAGTPNEVRALQGVSLTIEPGSFVVVIGTNGSGKSTLLNAVAGSFLVDEGKQRIPGDAVFPGGPVTPAVRRLDGRAKLFALKRGLLFAS